MSGIFDEVVEYKKGGFDPSKPKNNELRREKHELPVRDANVRDLQGKARQALQANATFLGLSSPTAAQSAAQVKALTRQMNALIRLVIQEHMDVSDT